MIKFLALGGNSKLATLKRKLKTEEVIFSISKITDVEFKISQNNIQIFANGLDVLDFDYVWLTSSWFSRSILYAVSLFLEKNKIGFSQIEQENSKLVDTIMLGMENLALPDTYFTSVKNIKENFEKIVKFCGYPFIVKPVKGLKGNDMFLINSKKEFSQMIKKLSVSENYLCQRFVPNTFDYRIIVANNEVVSVCKRIRQGDVFRNNTFLGAEEEFLDVKDLPADITELSIKAAGCLGLDWSGVDIVTCTESGKSYVLEVNRNPGFTEKTSEITAAYDHVLSLSDI